MGGISISHRSPKKLLQMFDLYDPLLDLLLDIDDVFFIPNQPNQSELRQHNLVCSYPRRDYSSINEVCNELHKLDFRL